MQNYYEILENYAKKTKNILCFGIDPDIEKIPSEFSGSTKQKIVKYYSSILDACPKNMLNTIKPNYAFFAQYGMEGILALREIIDNYKEEYIIILDVKRVDIGQTSKAYVKEIFEFFKADSATICPIMGKDSIEPYLEYLKQNPKNGVYFLCRTSNKGAEEFLEAQLKDGKKLYQFIARKVLDWAEECPNSLGLVVGATQAEPLKEIIKIINENGKLDDLALLIPGIGTQGGDPNTIIKIIRELKNPYLVRVNASSSIAYAYLKENELKDPIQAAIKQIKFLANTLKLE